LRKPGEDTYEVAHRTSSNTAVSQITEPASQHFSRRIRRDDHVLGFIYTGGGAGATFAPGKPANVQDAMLAFPG
jgi:hypothetical protein